MTKDELKEHCTDTLRHSTNVKIRDEHQLILDIINENEKLKEEKRDLTEQIQYLNGDIINLKGKVK